MFNRNEPLAPDNPCEKCCLEYVFYLFESKIADAIVRFKVINISILFSTFTSNVYLTAAKRKKHQYNNVCQYI